MQDARTTKIGRMTAGSCAIACVALLSLASCTPPAGSSATASAGGGKSVCINTYEIDHTQVVNDSTILFYMLNRKVWQNNLPFPCPELYSEGGFAYSTDINQICSNLQSIRVIEQGGGPRFGAVCQLGEFVPYVPPPKPPG
jgi:hypothetical protein